MRVVFWGTYDLGKPRTRILLRGLRENGVEVVECHANVWAGIEDKSQIHGPLKQAYFLLRWMFSYPGLVFRYLTMPRHDVVFIGYLGHLDALVLWPFARLRGVNIVWDAFLSIYNTVVEDRAIIGPGSVIAKFLYAVEWLSCRAAYRVVLDTLAQAEYFQKTFTLSAERTAAILVGAEPENFPRRPSQQARPRRGRPLKVLFYGQFIPLHGIETIVAAAQRSDDFQIDWTIIGSGQEERKIQALLENRPAKRLTWIRWVDYHELVEWIHNADLCLGIFGNTDKAARVIPNKIFQILATGTPFITRDSPAIRELIRPDSTGIFLVPPANPDALLAAVRRFADRPPDPQCVSLFEDLRALIVPQRIGARLLNILEVASVRPRPVE